MEILYTVTSRVNWTEAVLSCSKPGYTIADTYSFNKFLEEERLILFWVGIFRREFIKIDTGSYMCRFWQYRPYIFSAFLCLCQYFSFILKKLNGSPHRYSGHWHSSCPLPSVFKTTIPCIKSYIFLYMHSYPIYRTWNINLPHSCSTIFCLLLSSHQKTYLIYSPPILYTDSL